MKYNNYKKKKKKKKEKGKNKKKRGEKKKKKKLKHPIIQNFVCVMIMKNLKIFINTTIEEKLPLTYSMQ